MDIRVLPLLFMGVGRIPWEEKEGGSKLSIEGINDGIGREVWLP